MYIAHLWSTRRDVFSKPWFFIADDDTWVNWPLLLHMARQYSPDLKVG